MDLGALTVPTDELTLVLTYAPLGQLKPSKYKCSVPHGVSLEKAA